jgi:hypothetical protein
LRGRIQRKRKGFIESLIGFKSCGELGYNDLALFDAAIKKEPAREESRAGLSSIVC